MPFHRHGTVFWRDHAVAFYMPDISKVEIPKKSNDLGNLASLLTYCLSMYFEEQRWLVDFQCVTRSFKGFDFCSFDIDFYEIRRGQACFWNLIIQSNNRNFFDHSSDSRPQQSINDTAIYARTTG